MGDRQLLTAMLAQLKGCATAMQVLQEVLLWRERAVQAHVREA